MPLSKNEIKGLLRLVGLTRTDEINCEECLDAVAEFAEQKLAGKTVSGSLEAIEHHLSVCQECREEYEALRSTLGNMEGGDDG